MKIAIINLITRTSLCRQKVVRIQSNKDAMIVKFVKEMRDQGVPLDLYVSDAYKPVNDEDLDFKIHYLPNRFPKIFWPSRIPFTPSLFKELRDSYDIVICSESFQWSTVIAVFAKIFSFKKKIKIVVWQELAKHQSVFRGWPSIFFHKVILRYFLDHFISGYVPRSQLAAKFLIQQGINAQKVTTPIPHGYDQAIFFNDPYVKKERYLFSPSRLVSSKGVDILLHAFALVCQRVDNLELIIQGEGPMQEEYAALSRHLKINERVHFDSHRLTHDEMRKRYQKALVTVVSSRADNVIFSDMESMACGTPVILSTGIDSHENYQDGVGGRYFKNEDYQQLADILFNIVNDESLRKQMEEGALKKSFLYKNSYISKQFINMLQTIK